MTLHTAQTVAINADSMTIAELWDASNVIRSTPKNWVENFEYSTMIDAELLKRAKKHLESLALA